MRGAKTLNPKPYIWSADSEAARDDATAAVTKLRAGLDLALAETAELRWLLSRATASKKVDRWLQPASQSALETVGISKSVRQDCISRLLRRPCCGIRKG